MARFRNKETLQFRTSFHDEFPINEIVSPPDGWKVRFISRWRENRPDACWRLVLKLRPTTHKGERG